MIQLQAQQRNVFGKNVENIRKEGLVPAELYGHGKENIHLAISEKDLQVAFKQAGESTILEILIDGTAHPVLIHDIQKDPIRDTILHVDLYEVRMDEKVRTEVPIEFIGEAPAVKAYGGVLVKSLEAIEVEALPKDLPSKIEIDLSGLAELNQAIYVKDIPQVAEVKFHIDPETAVASVTEQAIEEEVATPPPSEVPTEAEVAASQNEEKASGEEK